MKKILAIALALVLVLTASACAEVAVCHHGDGKNCVAQRNTVGSVALEAPAFTYDNIDAVKAAGYEALLSTSGLFNAVYNGSASIVCRYELSLDANAVVPVKGGKLAIENGATEVETDVAPADFGTTFAVVRTAAGRFYGAVVICCCGGGNGTTKTAHSSIEDAVKEETDWDEEVIDLRTKTSHSEVETAVAQVSSSEFTWDEDEVVDLRGGNSSTAHGNVPVE